MDSGRSKYQEIEKPDSRNRFFNFTKDFSLTQYKPGADSLI